MRTADETREALRRFDERLEAVRRELMVPQGVDETQDSFRMELAGRAERFRASVAEFLDNHQSCMAEEKEWRRRVFLGEEKFNADADAAYRALRALHIQVAEWSAERAEFLGRHGHDCSELLPGLARIAVESKAALRDWTPPALSMSPGMRTKVLTPESAERFKAVLGADFFERARKRV